MINTGPLPLLLGVRESEGAVRLRCVLRRYLLGDLTVGGAARSFGTLPPPLQAPATSPRRPGHRWATWPPSERRWQP
jgi:hypothetical protein